MYICFFFFDASTQQQLDPSLPPSKVVKKYSFSKLPPSQPANVKPSESDSESSWDSEESLEEITQLQQQQSVKQREPSIELDRIRTSLSDFSGSSSTEKGHSKSSSLDSEIAPVQQEELTKPITSEPQTKITPFIQKIQEELAKEKPVEKRTTDTLRKVGENVKVSVCWSLACSVSRT